jgi:hypothetical protein
MGVVQLHYGLHYILVAEYWVLVGMLSQVWELCSYILDYLLKVLLVMYSRVYIDFVGEDAITNMGAMQLHSILVAEYWVLAGWDAITSMGVMQLHSRLLVEGLIDAFKSIYIIFVGEAAITSMALLGS